MDPVRQYIANITSAQQQEYAKIRQIVLSIVPDASEEISYGLPTFKYKGKPLLYFGAFKNHMSVFPTPQPVLDMQAQGKLTEFKVSKGTVQFTEKQPLPSNIIEEMVRIRLDSINGR